MSSSQRRWLSFFLGIFIGIGAIFRVSHLDTKIVWTDELYTSMRVKGYSVREYRHFWEDFLAQYPAGVSVSDMQEQANQLVPRNFPAVHDALRSRPEHPPLYYFGAYFWSQLFGYSVLQHRLFSAVISLLAFPALYWLCQELFGSPWIAGLTVALFAVSPFHLLYAQEARQYGLWTVTFLFSMLFYLRALRLGGWPNWLGYILATLAALYSHLLSLFLLLSQVFMGGRRLLSRQCVPLIGSWLVIALGFWPWLKIIDEDRTPGWVEKTLSAGWWLKRWLLGVDSLFLDLNFFPSKALYSLKFIQRAETPTFGITDVIGLLILGICVWGGILVFRECPLRVTVAITILGLGLFLPLFALDLYSGGIRSSIPRYLIPTLLSLQVLFAYALASFLTRWQTGWQRHLRLLPWAVLLISVMACVTTLQSSVAWTKSKDYYLSDLVQLINEAEQPVLVYQSILKVTLLVPYLEPHTRLIRDSDLTASENPITLGPDETVFLVQPVNSYFNHCPEFEQLEPDANVWRVVNCPE
ncbi:MAG: glycosyltransferase family 39 protein [Cyanobacteria bacterium P01_H01_bin.15]